MLAVAQVVAVHQDVHTHHQEMPITHALEVALEEVALLVDVEQQMAVVEVGLVLNN